MVSTMPIEPSPDTDAPRRNAWVGTVRQVPISINACPVQNPDWCHFAQRVERSAIHRRLKNGTMGYEDEKFSYFFFSRAETSYRPSMRLLASPRRVNRHINLDVCHADGTRKALFLNRRDTAYHIRHAARQLNWGFSWDP